MPVIEVNRKYDRAPSLPEGSRSPEEGLVQVGRFAVSPPLETELDILAGIRKPSSIDASSKIRKNLTEAYQSLGLLLTELIERNQTLCDENTRLHSELFAMKIRRRSTDSPSSYQTDSTP